MAGFFALSVLVPTPAVEPAASFFVERLGFERKRQGTGWSQVENGALVLRLVAADGAGPATVPSVEVEVVTRDLEATAAELCDAPGVAVVAPPERVRDDRIEMRLATPHGIVLRLARDLDEDDLGILPPLPTELIWDAAAERLIRELLTHVPVAFRSDARRLVTWTAEGLALGAGAVEVREEQALRGLLRATPPFRRREWRAILADRGIDPAPFAEELDAE